MIKMIKKLTQYSVFATAGLIFTAGADASIILAEDFEADNVTSFSGAGKIEQTHVIGTNFPASFATEYAALGTQFLRNDSKRKQGSTAPTIFNLGDLTQVAKLKISFDLLAIDSWDGSTLAGGLGATDIFNVEINSGSVFQETIDFQLLGDGSISSNSDATLISSGKNLGFNQSHFDTIYNVSFLVSGVFTNPTELSFFASGTNWTGGLDESWGIDNLVVESVTTPSLFALILLGIGGILFGRKLKR
jgi:hypothetical protein